MSYFRAENLSLHFGGLKAVDAVNFAVEKGEILSIIGPNGAGKSSIFNLISPIYSPTSGRIYFEDQDITRQPAFDIAKLGIARTFQNIELFENATVLSNLLVGRHRHSTTRLWQELLFMPSVRGAEVAIADCHSTELWTGRTDARGLAMVPTSAAFANLPQCDSTQTDHGSDYFSNQVEALSGLKLAIAPDT